MITSRQHALVKAFRAAARGDDRRALLDGWHLLHDALAAGIDIDTVAIAGTPAAHHRTLLDRVASSATIVEVTAGVMDALSPVRTPSGVAALVIRPNTRLPRVIEPAPALVVIGADIQDPGNVGAMIRSADAAGATGAVFIGASADPWGWKALRAAMGSTFRLPVVALRDQLTPIVTLKHAGLHIVATVPRHGTSMHAVDLRRPTALLLGSEGSGLPPSVLESADAQITIPMRAEVESLNVAVAAALLVYESRRQRTTQQEPPIT